jgi:predicted MFS family arabinose efflux permease
MGTLWLSTVPLTNGLVAQIFGVKYMSMLAGMVFFGHQIGSFLGAWMGGVLFDTTGSYTVAWLIAAGFGIFAALVHLPINEAPLARLAAA